MSMGRLMHDLPVDIGAAKSTPAQTSIDFDADRGEEWNNDAPF